MINNKFLKTLIPLVVFLGLSVLLFKYNAHFLWIFPSYGLIFLWFNAYNEKEVSFILLFLCTAIGFIFPKIFSIANSVEYSFLIFAEIFLLWLLFYILHKIALLKSINLKKTAFQISANLNKKKSMESEVGRYESHRLALSNRIKFQSELSSSIQYVSASESVDEIKEKLGELVKKYFNDSDSVVHSGLPRNIFEKWVFERKTPLFIRDAALENRFSPGNFSDNEKSLLIIPLHLFGSIAGFIKISSEEAKKFKSDDLRVLETISSICAVSMENIRLFEKVEELAIKDGLTKLYTHRAFEGRLQEEILRAARTKTPFSLIMTDVDYFKKYNDTYGHQAGDSVLKAVSDVLKNNIREVDFAARYGGEEFAIILTGISKEQAVGLAEHLRATIESVSFNFSGVQSGVTASFGVSEFPSEATI